MAACQPPCSGFADLATISERYPISGESSIPHMGAELHRRPAGRGARQPGLLDQLSQLLSGQLTDPAPATTLTGGP